MSLVHFLVKRPDGTVDDKQFKKLDDAWAEGSEVVVVDRYGQHHSLYNAYKRGMIYIKPILPKRRQRDPV